MKKLLERLIQISESDPYYAKRDKALSKQLMDIDDGPEGMRTIRYASVNGNQLTINCLAGSPVTGYLKGLLKQLGWTCKFINKSVGPGDHDYNFEIMQRPNEKVG